MIKKIKIRKKDKIKTYTKIINSKIYKEKYKFNWREELNEA